MICKGFFIVRVIAWSFITKEFDPEELKDEDVYELPNGTKRYVPFMKGGLFPNILR